MSLTIRSTMNNQAAAQGIDNTDKNTDNSKQTKNRKTINASELNLKPYKDNQIDAKRLRARKQAMKLIDEKYDAAAKSYRERYKELVSEDFWKKYLGID